MREFFTDYEEIQWVRFSPGAQYIVPKENILKYTKSFWEKLMHIVDYATLPMESFLLERAMWYIFSNKYEERK